MKFINRMFCLAMMLAMLCVWTPGAQAAQENQVVYAGGVTYYDADGDEVRGAAELGRDGAVVKVSKTVADTDVENEFIVTMQVQTIQDIRVISSTNPNAATQLVFDVSNSMDDCLHCGMESDNSVHGYLKCPDSNGTFSGWSDTCTSCRRSKSSHTWTEYTNEWSRSEPNGNHHYESRLLEAKAAAVQFMNDFRATSADGAKRYVSIITFGSHAVNVIGYNNTNADWIDISTTDGYNRVVNYINDIKVANNDYGTYNGGGTNIEGGLRLGYNVWQAGLRSNGTISGTEYQYTVLLTDGMPTYHVDNNNNTRNSVDAISGDKGGGNESKKEDAQDVGTIANNIRSQSSIGKLYSICFGQTVTTDGRGNVNVTEVFNTKPFQKWSDITPPTTTQTTIGQWLGAFSTGAFNGSATNLFDAFNDVMNVIKLEAKAWKVQDWMGDHIVYGNPVPVSSGSGSLYNHIITPDPADYAGDPNGTPAYVWDLLGSNADPALTNMQTVNGVTTGKLGYTFQYKVTLDNLQAGYSAGAAAQVNKRATLDYVVTDAEGNWPDANDPDSIKTAQFEQPTVKGLKADLSFMKVNESGQPLAGAQFRITHSQKHCLSGDHWEHVYSNTTGADGLVTITGLPSGHTYAMDEIDVPEGYLNAGLQNVEVEWGKAKISGLPTSGGMQQLVNREAPSGTLTISKQFASGSIIPKEIIVHVMEKNGGYTDQAILNAENGWRETIEDIPFGTYIVREVSSYDEAGHYSYYANGLEYKIYVDGVLKADAQYINTATDPMPEVEITLSEASNQEDNILFINNILRRRGDLQVQKTFIGLPEDIYKNFTVRVKAQRVGSDNQILTGDAAYTAELELNQAGSWIATAEDIPVGRYLLTETTTSNGTPGYTFAGSGFRQNGVELAHNIVEVKETQGANGTVTTVDLFNGYTRDKGHFHAKKTFLGLAEEQVNTFFQDKSIYVFVYDDEACTHLVDTLILKDDTDWEAVSISLPTGDYWVKENVVPNTEGSAWLPGYDLNSTWGTTEQVRKVTVLKGSTDHHTETLYLFNTYTQQMANLTISKAFGSDTVSQYAKNHVFGENGRSITVRILQGETIVKTVELNHANGFTVTEELPVGTYELEEVTAKNAEGSAFVTGYSLLAHWDQKQVTLNKGDNATATVTNTYAADIGRVVITKAFDSESELQAGDFDDRSFEMHVHAVSTVGDFGELKGTVRLNKANNWTAEFNLPIGTFYIGEEKREGYSHTALIPFYTLEVTGEGNREITSAYTPENPLRITITNKYTRDDGSLTIRKEFAGDLDKAYFDGRRIDVEVLSGDTVVETVTLEGPDWEKTITLEAGEYTLREVTGQDAGNTAFEKGYILDSQWTGGANVTVTKAQPAEKTVTNTYTENQGTLVIKKEFDGDLSYDDFASKKLYFDIFEKGSQTEYRRVEVSLDTGWKASVKLPVGEYTVEEAVGSGEVTDYTWTAAWKNGDNAAYIIKNRSDEVTMVNTYKRNMGVLKISKALDSEIKTLLGDATFTVNIDSDNFHQSVVIHADGREESVSLPVGTYTLTEVTQNIATPVNYTFDSVKFTSDGNLPASTITITNGGEVKVVATNTYTQDMATIKIRKAVSEEIAALLPANAEFNVKITPVGSDTAMIGFALKANGAETTIDLPAGEYILTEAEPVPAPENYTLESAVFTKQGVALTGNKLTLSKNETAEVVLTNTYTQDIGQLKLSKNVVGLPAGMLSEDAVYSVQIIPEGETSALHTVQLKPNGEVQEIELPTGKYTLVEQTPAAVEGYSLSGVTYTGDVTEGNIINIAKDAEVQAVVTNAYSQDTGKVKINKVVTGLPAELLTAETVYTVQIIPEGATSALHTVQLKPNGEVQEIELPTGKYTLVEQTPAAVEGYSLSGVTYTGDVTEGNIVNIAKDAEVQAVVTNTYSQDCGLLKVSKRFSGALDKTWFADKSITITVKNAQGQKVADLVLNKANDWSSQFGLPVGVYTLEETGADVANYGLIVTMTNTVAGTNNKVEIRNRQTSTVDITNTYTANPGTLTIRKQLAGASGGFPASVDFVVKGANGYEKTVTVSAASQWTATIENVPAGAYTVTEVIASNSAYKVHTQWSEDPSGVTIDPGEAKTLTCVNTYEGKVIITIPVQKTVKQSGNKAPGSMDFCFDVKVNAPEGSSIVLSYVNGAGNTAGRMQKRTNGGYMMTVNGTGTVAGSMIIEGFASELDGVKLTTRELLTPYTSAEAAEADGWIYDQTALDSSVVWCVDVTVTDQTAAAKISLSTDGIKREKIEFTNTYTKDEELEIPPTGDPSQPVLWFAMMVMACIGLVVTKSRRKNMQG